MNTDNNTDNVNNITDTKPPNTIIEFRKFEDVYNYIIENKLLIYNYIMFCYKKDRYIIVTKHALERLNSRFGEYFSDTIWCFLLTCQNKIIKFLEGGKSKSYTKRLRNEKNKYTTCLHGIRSIWAKKKVILKNIVKISLYSNSNIELIENYKNDEGDDIILISLYYFDAIKDSQRYNKKTR